MSNWKHQTLNFVNRGLDLIHPVDQVDQEHFSRLTNATSVQEGSLEARKGLTTYNSSALPAGRVDSIISIPSAQGAAAGSTIKIVGAGTKLYSETGAGSKSFSERDTGYDSGFKPKSLIAFQSRLTNESWVYACDGTRSRKIKADGTDYPIGIRKPVEISERTHMPPPQIVEVASIGSIYTANPHVAGDWEGSNLTVTAPTSQSVNVKKESRESAPGSKTVIQGASTVSGEETAILGRAFSYIDLQSGYDDKSKVELYLRISDPAHFTEIRLELSIHGATVSGAANNGSGLIRITTSAAHNFQTGDSVTISGVGGVDAANGNWTITRISSTTFDLQGSTFSGTYTSGGIVANFSSNKYMKGLVPSEFADESATLPRALQEGLQAPTLEDLMEDIYKQREERLDHGMPLDMWYLQEEIEQNILRNWRESLPTVTMPIGRYQWTALSIAKSSFIRVGTDRTLGWDSIWGARVTCVLSKEAVSSSTAVQIYEWDIMPSQSGLDSSAGIPYDWRYTFYNENLGIESNPSDLQPQPCEIRHQIARLTVRYTDDAQVTHLRIYRRGGVLQNYHLLAEVKNVTGTATATFDDTLDDLTLASRPTLELDNDEPVTGVVPRTNHCLYSEKLNETSVWTASNITVSPNDIEAPNGANTADLLTATSTDGTLMQTITGLTATEYYVLTVYIKRKTGTGSIYLTRNGGSAWDEITPVDVNEGHDPYGKWERFELDPFTGVTSATIGIRIGTNGDAIWTWGVMLSEQDDNILYTRYIPAIDKKIAEHVPTVAAIPTHFFGPFMGRYVFALKPVATDGDVPVLEGDIFWCKPFNPDAWPPQNRMRVTSPGEPLQNGFVYNGRVYVFSREQLYAIILNPLGTSTFISLPTPCNVGLWAEDALCVGDRVWFLGKNGIYETTGGRPNNLTEFSFIRPLFEGESVNGYEAVKWTGQFQMEWVDPYFWFQYQGASTSKWYTLRYHTGLERWEQFRFAPDPDDDSTDNEVSIVYWEAESRDIILGDDQGYLYTYLGTDDDAEAIPATIRTGAFDQGLSQEEKIYGDVFVEADIPTGLNVTVTPYLNDEASAESGQQLAGASTRTRYKISLGANKKARSISFGFTWTTAGASPVLYQLDISYLADPPAQKQWDSNYEDDGSLEDKWISGLYLEADTGGVNKAINIYVDGTQVTGSPFTINNNGRKPTKISIADPVRGVTMRFASTDGVEATLYDYRWIWEPEPVQLTNLAMNWDDLGWPYEKLIKGVSIQIDTLGQNKTLQLRTNGNETAVPNDIDASPVTALTVNSSGRSADEYAFSGMVRAHTVRLDPTDSYPGRLYKLQWIFDNEPPALTKAWTQEHSFGSKDYLFLVDAQICIRSSATATLRVTHDGSYNDYTIASTSGARRKIRVPFNPVKGKVFQFRLTCASSFHVYNEDTEITVQPFKGGDLQTYKLPFMGGPQNP